MSELKASLYLIRHGETDWNVEGRLQGTKDIDLNARGRAQAARNGTVLAGLLETDGLGETDVDWVASPLRRARDTMEILRREMGLDPADYRADPTLREVSFGEWEGETLKEVKVRDPEGHAARKADKWAYVPAGGESYEMLSARIRPWLYGLSRDTVCVAHGGITRVVRGMLEGIPSTEIPVTLIPQDKIYVWRDGRAEWI
ncbi:histidine phosphatase family protein [Microbaculum marinisediminis]|uniref:Histidine phosphatase family protein n=1 Tax=Microbaculum marinisediminis TaxID=2931392 RepID=A0AAW5QV64_9HYPH|nr:histidine phosphatase family protein [Microbaculum sp. A6E488]MCT8970258.1 histidine phosphatase family protein [Microbaculum sp. A6E488]